MEKVNWSDRIGVMGYDMAKEKEDEKARKSYTWLNWFITAQVMLYSWVGAFWYAYLMGQPRAFVFGLWFFVVWLATLTYSRGASEIARKKKDRG